jgi:hypothetical protein
MHVIKDWRPEEFVLPGVAHELGLKRRKNVMPDLSIRLSVVDMSSAGSPLGTVA